MIGCDLRQRVPGGDDGGVVTHVVTHARCVAGVVTHVGRGGDGDGPAGFDVVGVGEPGTVGFGPAGVGRPHPGPVVDAVVGGDLGQGVPRLDRHLDAPVVVRRGGHGRTGRVVGGGGDEDGPAGLEDDPLGGQHGPVGLDAALVEVPQLPPRRAVAEVGGGQVPPGAGTALGENDVPGRGGRRGGRPAQVVTSDPADGLVTRWVTTRTGWSVVLIATACAAGTTVDAVTGSSSSAPLTSARASPCWPANTPGIRLRHRCAADRGDQFDGERDGELRPRHVEGGGQGGEHDVVVDVPGEQVRQPVQWVPDGGGEQPGHPDEQGQGGDDGGGGS